MSDSALAAQAGPVVNVGKNAPPFVLAVGSVQTPYIASSNAVTEQLKANGSTASVFVFQGQAHDDTVWSLGKERGELFQSILKDDQAHQLAANLGGGLLRFNRQLG